MAKKPLDLEILYVPDPTKGGVVSFGDVYIGIPDTDPEVLGNRVPVTVLQEDGSEVIIEPLAQPLRTGAGGVLLYQGSPVVVLVDGEYSLKVNNSSGAQVYYAPEQGQETSVSLSGSSVPNGSFEAVTAEKPDNWTTVETSTGVIVSDSAEQGNGLLSLKFTSVDALGAGSSVSDAFNVNSGGKIDVAYQIFSTGANTRNTIEIDWLNSSGGLISTVTIADHTIDTPLSWEAKVATAPNTPSNAVQARIRLLGMNTGGSAMVGSTWFDSIAVSAGGALPIGSIIMYNGAFSAIPANWQLCDGTGGTPNLTDRFVYGTNTEGELLDVGGDADAVVVSHAHEAGDLEASNHSHSGVIKAVSDTAFATTQTIGTHPRGGGGDTTGGINQTTNASGALNVDGDVASTGVSGTGKNLPPYAKLAFIQRML